MRKMKITRNKIIAAAVILLVLTGAWFYGDHAGKKTVPEQTLETTGAGTAAASDPASSLESAEQTAPSAETQNAANGAETGKTAQKNSPVSSKAESGSAEGVTGEGAGKGPYQTDPVPAEKPKPTEPQNAEITDAADTCTMSVTCQTILDNFNRFNENKRETLPENGVIYSSSKVTFYEGESVFHVLQREMKKAGIQMEFQNTPIYNSAYIEGIHNIYEFDCGELSGWMYRVNGWFPNYGCSRYELQDGDVVEWVYTCDLGRDVGGDYLANTDRAS